MKIKGIKEARKFLKKNKFRIVIILFIVSMLSWYLYYISENQLFPKATLNFMETVQTPGKDDKVMVFSPHPDDETINVGGYIYESVKSGADVKIVLVTDGNKRNLMDKRYEEFKGAMATLGVDEPNLIFLGYPDAGIQREERNNLKNNFENTIETYDPDILVYSHPKDDHPDHAIVGQVIDSIKKDNIKAKRYKYLTHKRGFPQPMRLRPDDYVLPPVNTVDSLNKWENLYLTEEAKDAKMEALLKYKTQLGNIPLRELLYSFIRKNEIYAITEDGVR